MVHMNRNRNLSDAEWLQIASESIPDNENKGQLLIATGVIGGLIITGATSFPPAGVVFGAWCLFNAFKGNAEVSKNLESVEEYGYVAHCLSRNNLRDFRDQFGDEETFRQIEWARDRNFWVSGDAEDFADSFNIIPTISREKLIAHQPKLESVASSLGTSTYQQTNSTVDIYDPHAKSKIDIISEMVNPIGNFFIVGLGGSGKGIILSNALREIKRLYPNKKIFIINGKDSLKERGYFDGVVEKNQHKILHCETAKPATVCAWFEACVKEYDEFAAANNGALLIIDEGTIIGARLKAGNSTALGDKLIGVTSCGGDSNKNIWFIAQTPFAGANGSDLSGLGQLTPIAIVNKSNLAVLDIWKSAKIFKKYDTETITELTEQSPRGRAFYFGRTTQWYSMQELTNYSGYDRDTEKYLPGFEPVDEKINQPENSFTSEPETEEVNQTDADSGGFDFNKALEILRSFKGKDWVKFGDARANSKPLRKVSRDADDVRLVVSFLKKDGEAETKDDDLFRII